jgi:hypothetical protein
VPILVAVGVVVVGIAAIALVGPGTPATLRIPDSIGDLHRTPSEEASTPQNLIATYAGGERVVLLSVARTAARDAPASCTAGQCVWVSDGLSYTIVDDAGDGHATAAFPQQAEQAVRAVNR